MPMYEYRCQNCGAKFDELVPSAQIPDSDVACPQCGEYEAQKLMSAFASSGGGSVSYAGGGSSSCGSSSGFT
jgi:putative FmdB family regulatory protein